ncbi:MAG TPA: LLM class F420-dependent oxidoreductase [Actinomycetota bacterium]
MTLRIGIEINYAELQDRTAIVALARAAEDLGFDCIWCSEVYTYDAFTTLTHIACNTTRINLGTNIAQIYARTPALTATTAASLDQLSGGRMILGLGASGPQVIEGWHGVPYDRPVQRTREIIDICRRIWSGERVIYEGDVYKLTKGLKILNRGHRADIPIFVASLGPRNVEMTAETADGWLPFPYSTEHAPAVFAEPLAAGAAKRSPERPPLRVAPFAPAFVGDVEAGMNAVKAIVGFYIGGMGSREQNFYNKLVQRYGFVEEAQRVQELFLGGDRAGAIAATPAELCDLVSLVGDEARIRDRLQAFEASGASDLLLAPMGDAEGRLEMLEVIARANA